MAAAAVTMPSVPQLPVPVGSNTGKVAQEHLDWLKPTLKDTPISEMRRRLKEDGYLFLKNLIPREDVLKVRSE
jgi:phytanoyl-CoA hydroxylase